MHRLFYIFIALSLVGLAALGAGYAYSIPWSHVPLTQHALVRLGTPLARFASAPPTCTASSDPQTCANAFVQPFNRPFQIAVLALLSLIGGGCLITGLLSLARGVGGGIFNEPRWVSRALAGIGGAVLIFVVALVLVNAFGNINGLVPAPTLPQLGGGS